MSSSAWAFAYNTNMINAITHPATMPLNDWLLHLFTNDAHIFPNFNLSQVVEATFPLYSPKLLPNARWSVAPTIGDPPNLSVNGPPYTPLNPGAIDWVIRGVYITDYITGDPVWAVNFGAPFNLFAGQAWYCQFYIGAYLVS